MWLYSILMSYIICVINLVSDKYVYDWFLIEFKKS